LFRRLNEAGQLAGQEESRLPRARRLVFSVSLRSASLGVLGTFGGPSIKATLLPEEPVRDDVPQRVSPSSSVARSMTPRSEPPKPSGIAAQPPAAVNPPPREADQDDTVYEVLCILRNLSDDRIPADSSR
jgi:hypothetical protein